MRVAFDQQIFTLQRFGGVSRSFVEISRHLNLLDGVEARVIAPLHFNKHLYDSSPGSGIYIPKSSDFLDFNKKVRLLGEYLSQLHINRFKPDLIHETFYEPVSLKGSRFPIATTIQDLIREKIGIDKQKMERKKNSIERARLILCISESTKRELLEFYNPEPEKVVRVYLGVNESFFSPESTKSIVGKSYILFVGNRSGYKNWKLLVSAFANSSFLKSEFELICFGGGDFSNDEISWLNELRISNQVKQVKGGDDSLKVYYRAAACLVYPSEYEGFGLPVVEAMASHCPVVASDIDVLHESGGIAARYFESNDMESLKNMLENLLVNDEELSQMRVQGRSHASKFSWFENAKQTKIAYETLL